MPDELQLSALQVETGPLALDGETLIGIVVDTGYVFSVEHDFANDVTAQEVTPASMESRLTGVAAVTLTDDAESWLVTITGTTALDLSDVTDRGGIVWCRPGASDSLRAIVGFSEDIGGADGAYLPTWPDGLFSYEIKPLSETVAGVPFTVVGSAPPNVDADALAAALGITGGGDAGAVDATYFIHSGDSPGTINDDLSGVTTTGAILVPPAGGDSTWNITGFPDSTAGARFFIAAIGSGSNTYTIQSDAGLLTLDVTATSDAAGLVTIELGPDGGGGWIPLGSYPFGSGGGGGSPTGSAGGDLAGTYPNPTVPLGPNIHALTGKTTPVDADELVASDSAASNVAKKVTWANLKATLKTYFDTLYPSGSGTSTGTNTGDQTLPTLGSLGATPTSRSIATTAPLTGGGDLSADRTLAISAATTGAAGSMSSADKTKLDAITGTNTGDQTITLTGDVTGSGTGSFATAIGSSKVTSAMIVDGTIVNADINASAAIALSKLATDPLARTNHTGNQTASTISDFDTQVRTSRLDQMAAPTSDVSANSHKITNVTDPTSVQDAATKAYVDRRNLTVTATKTTAYSANAGEYVPVDTTSGTVAVTLPAAPADGTVVAVKRVAGATNTATVVCSGSDVFNVSGGSTSGTLTLLNQAFEMVYRASGAIWVVDTSLSLSQLDARFQPIDSDLTTLAGLTPTTDSFIQAKGSAWSARTIAQVRTDLVVDLSENYRGTGYHSNAGRVGSAFTVTNNRTYVVPFRVTNACTVIGLGVNVTTAVAATTIRLGILNASTSTFQPTTILIDAGTVASTATGAQEATISQALTPGIYWLACNATGGSPGISGIDPIGDPLLVDTANTPGSVVATVYDTAGSASGALPASTWVNAGLTRGSGPRITVHI